MVADICKFLIARVGEVLCGLPLGSVSEVMRPLPVKPLNHPLAGVKGLAVIRGHGVPVLDLAEILQKEPNIVGRFVTVRVGQRLCALAVSNVVGIKSISAEEHQDLPPLFRDLEATQGLAIFDHNVVLLLESARLFPMIQSIPEEEA